MENIVRYSAKLEGHSRWRQIYREIYRIGEGCTEWARKNATVYASRS